MKANILNYGKFEFMKSVHFPLEVECMLSERKTCIAVTPEQLEAAGVKGLPSKLCCHEWRFLLGKEAVITEE